MTSIGLATSNPFTDDASLVADEAQHAESLGYATLWRSGNLPMVSVAVRATRTIAVATGIIPVVRVPAADVIATHTELEGTDPGRFIVGLGGAHGPHPVATLNAYLDELDAVGVDNRMLAALGPNMLALARDRARGAYPFLVTPSYVAEARSALGHDRTLAVLLMVIPVTDPETARRAAAGPLEFLTAQGGYRRNLLRQGFTAADIDTVSDRLLDGIAAWGSPGRIAERIAEYHAAGADQVVLRILGADDVAAWRTRLAETLIS
ncbi:LLM class F420-dependent oxidoreductase [Mycobacterium sp. 852013-50091_SCH5140682]|uniref:TIGR03620 family F420-dependent LLM class oxidoreductase n=1 Tax=Mycobacterium sp. 852013-50091_SCH5140682 TaxID=1834109 RepID=UPI0007EAB531|nr:TIGR03620 family F420-dependent LLM class oxidoreductase [Mycobacterium sp. 852013-50091_SCH5140682]OBC06765.1 LLM class F420-dependent oxidoreductase [Mycobacterium sp. 852013-50091_SCH5140682]